MRKTKAPAITAKANISVCKDRTNLPRLQKKVYEMLLRCKCSAGDISAAYRISDPRGHIRDLREKGITILDEWCTGLDGVRFKRYWIEKEAR